MRRTTPCLSRDAQNRGYELFDLGPSLEYNFLLFNLNDVKAPSPGQVGMVLRAEVPPGHFLGH